MGGRGGGSGNQGNGGDSNPPPVNPPDPDDPTTWTWDKLTAYLGHSSDEDESTSITKTESWLKAHQSKESIPLIDDRMTKSEDFYSVTTQDGVTLLFTQGNDENAALTLMELAAGYGSLPDALKQSITQIVMTTQTSRNADGNILATAGSADNNIVVYGGLPISTGTLTHEAAHNLALKKWGSTAPPYNEEGTDEYYENGSSDYGAIVSTRSEPPVSDYAKVNATEDFAEAVKAYVLNPTELQRIAPLRYAVIHRMMTDPGYHG